MTPLIITVLLLIAWDFVWFLVGVKPLFPWQLKKLLRKKSGQLNLIDVRTHWEYDWFHVNGAVNKPELLLDINALPDLSREDPLIVICMSGHRSPLIAHRLNKRGFKKVYNLTGGMLAWKLFGMTKAE